jgi:hypothetical protein
MTEDTKGEIQQWYDRCYELLHALAAEILKYRRACGCWQRRSAGRAPARPLDLTGPGRFWRPGVPSTARLKCLISRHLQHDEIER